MNNTELLKLKEQFVKEYEEVKESFSKFCADDSRECILLEMMSEDNKNMLFGELLDGEEYDELEVEIPHIFYFSDGSARRKFDIFRKKAGFYNQMILRINEMLGEEQDDYWWDERTWGKKGLERLIENSKKAIAEEKAFIEFAEKGLKILETLPEEE